MMLMRALPLFVSLALGEAFDYVIIGGGTSGLVLANRLSENPNVTVAVIEAGTDVRDYPGVMRIDDRNLVLINESIDWQYTSPPQKNLGNRTLLYHAGKALGGSSTINGMNYIRGDEAEYNAWELLGNKGWNWDGILPYFKRSENFTIPTPEQLAVGVTFEEVFHGEDGFLTTGFPFGITNSSSFYEDYSQAWDTIGVTRNADLDSGHTEGFGLYPQTLDRDAATRESSARAYYQPIESRENLKIVQGTVSKINWGNGSGESLLADGVEYVAPSGEVGKIDVAREVILSAGSFRSPLVLEASGIGHADILSQHDIKTRVDLPSVGQGMQDQELVTIQFASPEDIEGYLPYATFVTAQDLFGDDVSSVADETRAKIPAWAQVVSESGGGALSPEVLETRFRIQHDLIFKDNTSIVEIVPFSGGGVIGGAFWTLLPFSLGNVHLNTSSAADYPTIAPNFLAVDFDIQVLTAAGRLVRKHFGTAPLSDWVTDQTGLGTPATNATDSEWKDYILGSVTTTYHMIGTNAMLPRDLGGVVDSRLKVYGTQNVRVVDASAVPLQISGHPTATLYAFAERAADLIKADCVL